MKPVIPWSGESLLGLATRCDAMYLCPKVGSERKGPLVVYAGKDEKGRNLVGDIYFNFRRIETHPMAVEAFAAAALQKLRNQGLLGTFDTICGIPQGGRTFGQELARISEKKFVYADKIPKPPVPGKKHEYTWDLSQFEFEPGERVAVAEDVFNNFQNTDSNLEQIAAAGVDVTLLVGALNRSSVHDMVYTPKVGPFAGRVLSVVASIREPYPEYEQDDPEVAADIAAGNLELEVKKNWAKLRACMEE